MHRFSPRASRFLAFALLLASLPATAQSLRVSSPQADMSYFPGQDVPLSAEVGIDVEPIASVEFFVDGKSQGIDTDAPYAVISPAGELGSHRVHATATTAKGATLQAEAVTFNTVRVTELLDPMDGMYFRVGDVIPFQALHRLGGSGGYLQFFAGSRLLREIQIPGSVARAMEVPQFQWADAPAGTHVLKTVALSPERQSLGESNLVTITVEAAPLALELRAPSNPLRVTQGVASTVQVAVVESNQAPSLMSEANANAVEGAELEWIISRVGFPDSGEGRYVPKLSTAAACETPDAPSQGVVSTDSEGLAAITFTAGCNGERSLWVRVLGRPDIAPARLPFAQETSTATTLRALLDGAPYLVAEPGKAAPLRVQALDSIGNPIADAVTDWTLTPGDTGAVSATVNSGSDGVATGSVTLSGQRSASVRVCVRDQPASCIDIQIRSTAELITRPVQQIIAPIAQQAIETSRTQLGLLRSRMGQLRNERGHGFCDGASVQVQGLSMPMCGGGGGDSSDGGRLGSFVMGNATLGKRDADGRWSGYELLTRGLTGGVDYRFSQQWVGGAALGIARGSVDVGNVNTQDSSGVSGSLFGQWMPNSGLFATGVLSIGRNSFDIERRGSDDVLLSSETDSRQSAMQVELGYSVGKQAFKLTPYARYELVHVDVDGLSENGGPEAVAVDAYSLRNSALSAGLSADYAISSRSGVWIPSINVEFHNETQNLDVVHARLVNGRYGNVDVAMPEDDNRYGSFGFNLQWLSGSAGQPISSFIGYGMIFGRDNVESRSFTLGVKLPF